MALDEENGRVKAVENGLIVSAACKRHCKRRKGVRKTVDLRKARQEDVVPVVRCRYCKWAGETDENGWRCCNNLSIGVFDGWFCADGERKEGD